MLFVFQMAAGTHCEVGYAPVASDCTVACGILTQVVVVAQSGQGDACLSLETYACQDGEGDCGRSFYTLQFLTLRLPRSYHVLFVDLCP